MFSFLAEEQYFDSGRNVLRRSDRPNVDLDGETQNIEIAVRAWWEKRDWIRLFYLDFAKLHFTWPPSRGDWHGLVAEIILAYEEGDASKIARAHYALAEEYFYEAGAAFPDSVLNCDRSDACISECRKAVEIQPANLEFRHFLIYICAQFSRAFDALTECLNMMRIDPSEAKKSTTGNSPEFYLTNSNVMNPRRYYSRLTLEEKRRAEKLLMPLGDTIPTQDTVLAGFGFQTKPMLTLCEQGVQESAALPVPPEYRASIADWPVFHGNNGRTGHAVEAIVPPLKELWCFDAGTELGSGPVVSGGRVLVGTRESLKQGRLLAVDANSGKKLWEFPTNGMITSHATVHDGLVYFGCWDTRFYAVDLQTGRAVWHFTNAPKATGPIDGIWNGNPLVVNDMVTALAQDLYILDAKSGRQIWKCRNPEYVGSSPAEDDGLLYVGFYRELAIIDLAKKRRVGSHDFNQEKITSGPSIVDGLLLVGTNYGRIYAMDMLTRETVWMFEMKGKLRSEFRGATESCPTIGEGRVVLCSPDGNVYALEHHTGRLMWSFQTNSTISGSAVISGSVVYISSDRGDFYALSIDRGKLLWHYETLAAKRRIVQHSSPAICDGKVYVAWDKLYAFGN